MLGSNNRRQTTNESLAVGCCILALRTAAITWMLLGGLCPLNTGKNNNVDPVPRANVLRQLLLEVRLADANRSCKVSADEKSIYHCLDNT